MCLYDGQIYEQIPTLRIGVAVEEAVCYNFRIGPIKTFDLLVLPCNIRNSLLFHPFWAVVNRNNAD